MRGKAYPALWLLCVLVFALPTQASLTSTGLFDSSRSTVLQTGGLPDVQIGYAVRGWFQLTVDPNAGTASFDTVDANLLDDKGNIYGYSLNQIFNMTGLTGAVIDNATMEFVGKNVGRTQNHVRLTLTLADGSARLTGQVTPPPNGADSTVYELDAVATMSTKYGDATGKPGEILFRFDADREIVSTPAIGDGGTIYFGTLNATLYALDRNGNLKWQWKYDCSDGWCPQAFESSPALGDDGTIYVADDIAIPNYLFAIFPEGHKKWEYSTSIVYGSMDASPVLLSDRTIFVGAHGFSFGAGNFGQLVALTPDGTVLDGFPLSTGAISASPIGVADLVIVGQTARRRGGCNAVFAVQKSANIIWKTEFCGTPDASGWFYFSSLAMDRHNNVFVANNYSDYFPKTGPPVLSSAVVQLDAETGKQLREMGIPTQSVVVGSPVIEAAGQDANVIVATENGHVISFNVRADGAKLNYDLAFGENSEAVGSPVIGDNGKLYHAVNSTGDVNQIDVFEINTDGTISESFHVLIFNDHVLSSLSMDDNGVMYFGTKAGRLYAVQTGAGGLSKTAPWPTFRHDRKNTGNPEGPFVKAPSTRKNIYAFLPDQSRLVQAGGIAGIHRTYTITGTLQLTLDFEAGTASFEHVDVSAVDDSPYRNTLDLNDVFNMTGLAGTMIDTTAIQFEGTAVDGSSVLITLTFADDAIILEGQTTPPANSADLFVFSLDAVAQRKYAGGTGVPDDPYRIATAADLITLGQTPEDFAKHYLLIGDIDLDPNLPGRKVFDRAVIAPDTNDATAGFQGAAFTGVLDGNGHTITRLAITGKSYLGLFGKLALRGVVKNLGVQFGNTVGTADKASRLVGHNEGLVTGCYSTGPAVGSYHVGGLVGVNAGTVSQCYSTSAVTANESSQGFAGFGGLVGANEGNVTQCYSTSSVGGTQDVGGLAGVNSGTIEDSYAAGRVVGDSSVGGLVGRTYLETAAPGENGGSRISRCYAVGSATGTAGVGGLVGSNTGSVISDSFWDAQTRGQSTSAGGTGKTTTEMQTARTFLDVGWDFVGETTNGTQDIWRIDEGKDYPRLWWQTK